MAARSYAINMINATDLEMTRVVAHLDHGVWSYDGDSTPPDRIDAGETAYFRSESDGFMTGTQGHVIYSTSAGEFRVDWDNPYSGRDSTSASCPQGYYKYLNDSRGDNAALWVGFNNVPWRTDQENDRMPSQRIVELMRVAPDVRDLSWLRQSLQSAVELEFATLPAYLVGMWSIREQQGEAHRLINSVVMEEMLHMGLACNMLVAIGGTPRIVPPVYPGHAPGGVLPDLEIYLAGLSPETIDLYMSIEKPEDPVEPTSIELMEEYPTIGQFYDAILDAFQTLDPSLTPDRQIQLVGNNSISVPDPNDPDRMIEEPLPVLTSLEDVAKAIETIKEQGEGTGSESPLYDGELGHYYRFGEIRYGKRFIEVEGGWDYAGDPVPFPDCYPVATVPASGYPDLPAQQAFAEQYTLLIELLQSAWSDGGPPALDEAIGIMMNLYSLAKPIIETPLPDGDGNYGPDFIPLAATPFPS